jgi:hypothetical protein
VRESTGDVVASAGVTGELGAIGIGDDIVRVAMEAAEEGVVFDGGFILGQFGHIDPDCGCGLGGSPGLSHVFNIGIWEHPWAKGVEHRSKVGGRAAGLGPVEVVFIGVLECGGEVVRGGEARGAAFNYRMGGGE